MKAVRGARKRGGALGSFAETTETKRCLTRGVAERARSAPRGGAARGGAHPPMAMPSLWRSER